MIEYTFRYKVEGQLGTSSKIIKARSETEAYNKFLSWIQDQATNGITIREIK
jgi:hypothetical protein